MHCLYCDRPLALLKRLTGDGEFCSKEHRKIYQREHNQLALERLLETQPGANRKAPTPPKQKVPVYVEPEPEPIPELLAPEPEVFEPEPAAPVAAATENLPELAEFLSSSYPPDAEVDPLLLRSTGDPRFPEAVPVTTSARSEEEWKRLKSPQPKAAVFHAESPQPLGLDGGIRRPEALGFGDNIAPRLDVDASLQELPSTRRLSRAEFVSSAYVAAQRPQDRIERLAAEPRWKALEPVLLGPFSGRIVFVMGSLLSRPLRTAPVQDGLSEVYEIRLQPVSFPPLSPRMACLEERLHRTDRIGFSPP